MTARKGKLFTIVNQARFATFGKIMIYCNMMNFFHGCHTKPSLADRKSLRVEKCGENSCQEGSFLLKLVGGRKANAYLFSDVADFVK